jgi:hypothetical protein
MNKTLVIPVIDNVAIAPKEMINRPLVALTA